MAAIGYLGLDGVLIQGSGASSGYQIYANGGNITINGSSGTDGGRGVQINGGAHVITTGNGTITITGQGANGNDAILIKDASNTTISTVAGELKLDGSLNGSGGGYGVHISNGATVQTNSGPLNIIGQGGAGYGGVIIENTGTLITTASGAISMTGTGGTDPGGVGVQILDGAVIKTNGGALTITGTGGDWGNDSYGIYTSSATLDTSNVNGTAGGNITLNGTGGSNPDSSYSCNHGVFLDSGTTVRTGGGSLMSPA